MCGTWLHAGPALVNSVAPLFEVRNLSHHFGGLMAISGLGFSVPAGIVKGVIGPNGAGKTTLFNLIAGLIPVQSGEILFKGQRIDQLRPHRRVALGLSRTFQNLQIFAGMSVLENVMMGCHTRGRAGFLSALLRLPSSRREDESLRAAAQESLERLGIGHLAQRPASEISFGECKIVEIARAIAANPDLIMLDEPTAGLPHGDSREIAKVVRQLRDEGHTVMLVEHNIRLVMDLCDEIVVINFGQRIAEGTVEEVRSNPDVLTAYLGSDDDAAA